MTYPPPPEQPAPQTPAAGQAGGAGPQYSPDGRWYWDGRQWLPVVAPGPAWGRPYAPAEGRAAAAVALVGVGIAAAALFLLGEGLHLLATLFAAGSALALAAGVIFLVGYLAFAVGLVGGAISVPMWMHRAYRNLPALGAQGLRWSPAWAAGAWFIPVANFVIPYGVMRELWRGSGGPPESFSPGLWWAALLGANAVRIAAVQVARFSPAGADVLGMVSDLGIVAAGVLLILIIRQVTGRQRARGTGQ